MPRRLKWEELERGVDRRALLRLSLLLGRGPTRRRRGLREALRLARLAEEASQAMIEVVECKGAKTLRWRG